tara:strand:- start:1036 stop:1272 length:237 start_codon:yes stop_codon:yes gene_type:complete
MSDISEKVKKIVVEHLGVEESKVNDSASFIDDLGADSLDTVELVMAFEEEFECEIPDDIAEKILTIGDAIKYIENNKN